MYSSSNVFIFILFSSFFFSSQQQLLQFSFSFPHRKLCGATVPAVSSFHPLGLMPVPRCRTPRAVPVPIMLLFSLEKWLGAPLPPPLFSILRPSQGGRKQGGGVNRCLPSCPSRALQKSPEHGSEHPAGAGSGPQGPRGAFPPHPPCDKKKGCSAPPHTAHNQAWDAQLRSGTTFGSAGAYLEITHSLR